jgi:hypothetical protein
VTGHYPAAVLLLVAAAFAFDTGERGLGAVACALALGVLIDAASQSRRRWP